jgi:ABC-2 type transport system ATP-binding protein
MIAVLLLPNQGKISVAEYDISNESMQAKKVVGVVPKDIALNDDLSARENLTFCGKMYGLRSTALKKRVDEILDIVGLSDRQKGRVGKFSGGM